MKTRREFFGSLFRAAATAAALAYAPSVLRRTNVICSGAVIVNGIKKEFADALAALRTFRDTEGEPLLDEIPDGGAIGWRSGQESHYAIKKWGKWEEVAS